MVIWDLSWENARLAQHEHIYQCQHHTNRIKEEHHMIISIDAERVLVTLQHPFIIKTLKLGIEINFLNLIKAI